VKLSYFKTLCLAAALAALAGCAGGPPPKSSPLVRRAPLNNYAAAPTPMAREATPEARSLMAQAGAFESYMRRARAIDAAFSGPGEVAQALQTGAAHEPVELESGMVAYAALAALQEPRFVAAVRADRSDLARRLAADPRVAFEIPGADMAGARASGALYAQGAALSDQGAKVKRAAYTVQHQAWSTAKVTDPSGRLARVKRLSAVAYEPARDDAQHLQSSLTEGARRPGPPSPLVARGVALAALSLLGQERQARALMSEPRTTSCLHMAKLNLYQCLASAGPHYEDIFCLGQHAMIDTGQCVVEATRTAPQRQATLTPTSFRP
jgi:hypothetical protein